MIARIIEDLLNEEGDEIPSRAGMSFGDGNVEGKLYIVRLLDDDRIPYFVGISDDASLEPLYEWGMHDSGTTILQIMDLKTYEWEDCIG